MLIMNLPCLSACLSKQSVSVSACPSVTLAVDLHQLQFVKKKKKKKKERKKSTLQTSKKTQEEEEEKDGLTLAEE
ncbi:hypothetical protein INR49_015037 [Caranx melampygus]|nr:hypothetical protein INR49_015037 [Caranx melampygus]